MIKAALLFAVALAFSNASPAADSRYTDLGESHCVVLDYSAELASSVSECPGLAGYRVLLVDSDGRQSLRLVDAGGTEHDFRFASTVATGFSVVGAKLEWRYGATASGIEPYAAIVRLNAQVSEGRTRSYLVVMRLRDGPVCVIDSVAPGQAQNQKARDIADARLGKACRQL